MNPLLSNPPGAAAVSEHGRTDPTVLIPAATPVVRFGPAEKLLALGCVSGLAYALVAAFFWTDAIFARNATSLFVKLIGIGIPSVLYLYGARFVKRAPLRVTLGFAVLFAVIGSLTLPFDSTDAFFYIADGWRQFHYDQNPYSGLMRDIPALATDPIINNQWMEMNKNPWQDSPFPYGFGFAILTRTIAGIGAGNWWAMLAMLNGLNLVVHFCMIALLWKTARLIPSADPRLVLYLYAWNPMVLMQSLANVHNDILMAFGILAAAYFVLKGDPKWAIPVLVLAGLVKYGAFVLIPFACLMTFRSQGLKAVLKGVFLGSLVGVLSVIPYWSKGSVFKYKLLFLQTTESGGSLHAFVATLLRVAGRAFEPLAPVAVFAGPALQSLLLVAFLCLVFHQFVRAARVQFSAVSMIQMWTTLLFVAICIVSPQFYSWYLVIVIPIAVLSAGAALGRAILLLTTTHVLAFADLRRKSIGYFAICTLLPMAFLYWQNRKELHHRGTEN